MDRCTAEKPLHVLENAAKVPMFDCRDCGDCSLPDVAYLCPVSQCPKGERNGPCGGSHDGLCEVLPRPCVWVRAYDRLKPYGEELAMLDRAPVLVDHALERTSAALPRATSTAPASASQGWSRMASPRPGANCAT